jgi:hypothetical protein
MLDALLWSFQAPLEVGLRRRRDREGIDDLAQRAGRDGGGLESADHADAGDEETIFFTATGAGVQMGPDDLGHRRGKETVVIVVEATPEPVAVRSVHDWSPRR